MNKEDKQKVFALLAQRFETEEFKAYYMDMVAEIPDYIFTMPSSTSGKYHNATQCMEHGQIYHIFMFDSILNHRLRLKGNKDLYPTPEERDAMRCVPAFHDAVKCGWNGSKFTVVDHPMLAKQWVLDTKVEHDIPIVYKQAIADMCESHSGEWNKDRSGKVIMSEPRNLREFFIHECDILASRNDLDYIIPAELKAALDGVEIETEPITPDNCVVNFGKFRGKTVREINEIDSTYVDWMRREIDREPFITALEQL